MPPHSSKTAVTPLVPPLRSVVIVDDDPKIVDGLERLLGEQGFAVEGFTDPVAALARLRGERPPDVVLADCLMPHITGAELMDALAREGIKVPVVLMTALADPEFCVDMGRVSVVHKPFVVEGLLAELDAAAPRSG